MKLKLSIYLFGMITLLFSGCSNKSIDATPANFSLSDLYGNATSLSQFAGEPVIINFWRLDCPGCIKELPFIQAVYTNQTTATNIITIAIRDSQSALTQFMVENAYTFPVLQDKFGTVTAEYDVRFTPTTYFINSYGKIADIKVGPFANINELENFLKRLD
ncbi:MAG: TlpA disulfide reductase family protein [Dehalogenimonas sp.]|uniref:TlpA disulfide reductase family protein n=1 Tax=Candidatus Dehalogenimonas loeffleri TaxID=3127115 RepID=A0ABZ2J2R9_9CHLR|nr:TlpA disulfide reductase family protein [Dehalogenimonas sp.]